MYVVIRRDEKGEVKALCFVHAKDGKEAKQIVGVLDESTEWTYLPSDLLSGFAGVREGYFVKQL